MIRVAAVRNYGCEVVNIGPLVTISNLVCLSSRRFPLFTYKAVNRSGPFMVI